MPRRVPLPPITPQEARDARLKNIIELGLDFSAMTRVFAAGSYDPIVDRLEEFVKALSGVASKADYEGLHADFCNWFTKRICTAGKHFKSGRSNPSCQCSYGQAAKVLDVAAKVYVYYCGLPSPEVATRLLPLLHAAIDTAMMGRLGVVATLHDIDRSAYADLQDRVFQELADSKIHPVQWDDVIWRRLARSSIRP